MGLFSGLLHDAVAPLLDEITNVVSRVVRTIVLYLVAGMCAFATLISLTVALDIWLARLAGPLIAALCVAGLYALFAVICVLMARASGHVKKTPAQRPAQAAAKATSAADGSARPAHPETSAAIDQAVAPLLDILRRKGLKREQMALMTGALLAKRAGPLPLAGIAAIVGFVAGRFWKTLLSIAETSAVAIPVLTDLLSQLSAQTGVPITPSEPET